MIDALGPLLAHAHAREDPHRGDGLTGCPNPNLARSPATYQRLRQTIAERMRMSHVVQPLML